MSLVFDPPDKMFESTAVCTVYWYEAKRFPATVFIGQVIRGGTEDYRFLPKGDLNAVIGLTPEYIINYLISKYESK